MSSLKVFPWFQLNNLSEGHNVLKMVSINQHEFIIVTSSRKSIERFNINTNQWTSIKCDEDYCLNPHHDVISFCQESQKLYFAKATINSLDDKDAIRTYERIRTLDIRSGNIPKSR